MKILILGGNSYIAKQFIMYYHDKCRFTIIKRNENLKDYFELSLEDFVGFDVVINFTAIVHQKKADEYMHEKYNFLLVKHLANLAKEAKTPHFIQFSTIAVYGNIANININSVAKPTSSYGKHKLNADNYLQSIENENFKVSILRPPVIYGKDAPGNMQQLISLIKLPLLLPLGYRGNQRAILCVTNLSYALGLIIEKKVSGIFLLKDEESPSIGMLTSQIQKATNRRSIIIKMPLFVINLMLKSKIMLFQKLFANLTIDDSMTVSKVGNYHKFSWQKCMDKIV